MITRRKFIALLAAAPVIAATRPAFAAQDAVFNSGGIAINGYDPVAYFTENAPVYGNDAFTFEYNGAEFRFASAGNLAQFETDPLRFAPQYGGYCAYAVSLGATATTVPEAFTVYKDKLYLNNTLTVREIWSKDKPGNIVKANANWPAVLG